MVPLSEGFCKGSRACACVCGFPGSLREGLISDSRATNPWVKGSCFVTTGSQVTSEMQLEVGRVRGFSNGVVL